jgi:ABC-type sugar transport system ATPase subunit
MSHPQYFAIIRSVTEDGVAVVYISHRISEIRDLADDITVLRDGRVVSTGTSSEYDTGRIVGEMVGRDVDTVFPQQTSTIGDVVLRVSDTRTDTSDSGQIRTSLELRAGEIVGIAGLLGSGRSRLLRSIAGVAPQGSHVWVNGKLVGKGIRAAIQAGLVLVPEERKTEGLVLNMSVKANVTLADLGDVSTHGILFRSRENAVYEEEKQRLNIRATSGDQKTDELSGGNQQKVVLAKWLRRLELAQRSTGSLPSSPHRDL